MSGSDTWGHIIRLVIWSFYCALCGRFTDYEYHYQAEAIREARFDGWKKREMGWVCPKCTGEEGR